MAGISDRVSMTRRNRDPTDPSAPAPSIVDARRRADHLPDATNPVTLAERPHPFPSRTRKLSSPAPKILRGQPFGKIGRRQDLLRYRASAPVDPPGASRSGGPGRPRYPRRDDRPTGEPTRRAALPRQRRPPRDRVAGATGLAVPRGLSLPASRPRAAGAAPTPRREHRCARRCSRPPRSPSDKQRQLCLVAAHGAARPTSRPARGATMLAPGVDARRSSRPLRPAAVARRRRSSSSAAASRSGAAGRRRHGAAGSRPRWSALMVVAFVVLVARADQSPVATPACDPPAPSPAAVADAPRPRPSPRPASPARATTTASPTVGLPRRPGRAATGRRTPARRADDATRSSRATRCAASRRVSARRSKTLQAAQRHHGRATLKVGQVLMIP